MKRLFLLALIIGMVAFMPRAIFALTVHSGQNVILDSASSTTGVYAAGGGTVDLAGAFDDDVYLGGGTISVSGPVSGDLFIGGGTVKVTGEVKGSVRVAGGTVEVNGKVGGNVMLMGGTLTVGKNADIAGETTLFGGTVVFDGHSAKSINAWLGSLLMNGRADGEVNVYTSDDCGRSPCVAVGPSAVVSGNFTYAASQDAQIDPQAKISGTITRKDIAQQAAEAKKFVQEFLTFGRLWNLFSVLVVGLLIALLLPKTVRSIGGTMVNRVGASVGWGALLFFATPLALIVLAVTLIGIPLALILGGLYVLGIYISQIFLGFVVGEALTRRIRRAGPETKPIAVVWPTLLGIVVVSLIFDFVLGIGGAGGGMLVLSFLLGIVRLFLLLWPFGALVLVKWGYIREKEA